LVVNKIKTVSTVAERLQSLTVVIATRSCLFSLRQFFSSKGQYFSLGHYPLLITYKTAIIVSDRSPLEARV